MKYKWIFGIMLIFLLSCVAEEKEPQISGTIEMGLRLITLDAGRGSFELHVYRGDYVRFLKKSAGIGQLVIQDMDLNLKVPMEPNEEPKYIKFKNAGTFSFTLDGKSGTITVHEYVKSNYYEVSEKEGRDLLNEKSPLILDVRTESEFNQGHLKGSILIPVGELQRRVQELDKYKTKPVFIYCATGNRSTVASKILKDKGFKEIYNLRRGISGWISAGYPVVK